MTTNKGLFGTNECKTEERTKTQEWGVVLWENRGTEKHRKHIDRGVWNVGIITQDSQNTRGD
jgi:hypothetical protein